MSDGDTRKLGKKKFTEKYASVPEGTRGLPECPRHLKGRARHAWSFWRDELADMQQDRRPDAMMLEGACVTYSRAVAADIILAEQGLTIDEPVVDREGELLGFKVKKHPAVEISNSSWRLVRGFCSDFGLSPVSRTRLSMEKKDESDDDLIKILSAPRVQKAAVQ